MNPKPPNPPRCHRRTTITNPAPPTTKSKPSQNSNSNTNHRETYTFDPNQMNPALPWNRYHRCNTTTNPTPPQNPYLSNPRPMASCYPWPHEPRTTHGTMTPCQSEVLLAKAVLRERERVFIMRGREEKAWEEERRKKKKKREESEVRKRESV